MATVARQGDSSRDLSLYERLETESRQGLKGNSPSFVFPLSNAEADNSYPVTQQALYRSCGPSRELPWRKTIEVGLGICSSRQWVDTCWSRLTTVLVQLKGSESQQGKKGNSRLKEWDEWFRKD